MEGKEREKSKLSDILDLLREHKKHIHQTVSHLNHNRGNQPHGKALVSIYRSILTRIDHNITRMEQL